MSKISQQVQNQVSASGKVAASARTHLAKIAAALADALPPPPPPAVALTAAQWEVALVQLAMHVEGRAELLKTRELEYTAEQADDGPVREARDTKVAEVISLVVKLRSAVDDHMGRNALRTYGLKSETPRAPRTLLGYVQNVVSLLGQAPAAVSSGFGTFDTAAAANALSAQRAALEALVKDDDREARELEDALTRRNRASADWATAYQGVAAALEGLYRLAGWKELADRVRPTQRTIRGEDAGEEIEEGGEGGGGDAPAEG